MRGNHSNDAPQGAELRQLGEERGRRIQDLGNSVNRLFQESQHHAELSAEISAEQAQPSSFVRRIDVLTDQIYDTGREGLERAVGFFKRVSSKDANESPSQERSGYEDAKKAHGKDQLRAKVNVEMMRFRHYIDPQLPEGSPQQISDQYQYLRDMLTYLESPRASDYRELAVDLNRLLIDPNTLRNVPVMQVEGGAAAADESLGQPSAPEITPPPAVNPYNAVRGGAAAVNSHSMPEIAPAAAVQPVTTLTIETIRTLMESLKKRTLHFGGSGLSKSSNTIDNMNTFLRRHKEHTGPLTTEQLKELAIVYILRMYSKSRESHLLRDSASANSIQGILYAIADADKQQGSRLACAVEYYKSRSNIIDRHKVEYGYSQSKLSYDFDKDAPTINERFKLFFPDASYSVNHEPATTVISPETDTTRMERELTAGASEALKEWGMMHEANRLATKAIKVQRQLSSLNPR